MEVHLQDGRVEENPVSERDICALADLDDPGARGFTIGRDKTQQEIFLVRKDQSVFAYLNRCPHANQRLDARPDRFLTMDETKILCGAHAALFRIEDGFCTSGPCAGKHLEPVEIEIADGRVRIAAE
jgi:nitrite reductase/ring-hydroxylating ferredoxin subunit